MELEKERIIEKIQKILILAEDQKGLPEGDTAKRQAAILMAKYRIKETEVDLETDNFILDSISFQRDGKDVPQWMGRTVSVFCNLFDCQSIFRTTLEGQEWEIIGTFSDVEVTKYFIEVASHHIEVACWKAWGGDRFSKKRQQLGNVAVDELWERCWELKAQMDASIHEDSSCSALVVQKKGEVREAMKELYPNLRASRGKKIDRPGDSKTLNAGKEAGKTCPLNLAID